MGADYFYIFYGVKYKLKDDDELEKMEEGNDERIKIAQEADLDVCYDRLTDGEDYFLLVGYQIGIFGVEGDTYTVIDNQEIEEIRSKTDMKLKKAGIEEEPKWHFQLAAQY